MSVTDMHECPHGPIKDCHKCMFRELVEALEDALAYIGGTLKADWGESDRQAINRVRSELLTGGRALIEKAKQIDPDCIPYEEAQEIAANQSHRYG
ncbi:hypothetical protein LCGC14_0382600 [marine sediment metagenome]|uniref:Uncharacterized protein n=1 Tax=marine sediment metagenome TaxID=412755 RepID=A0A0F9VP79_9ZZZZ